MSHKNAHFKSEIPDGSPGIRTGFQTRNSRQTKTQQNRSIADKQDRILVGMCLAVATETMSSSNILLVDDETAILSILSSHLRDKGYSVDVAASRETAETLLSARQYEVVVVDLSLPSARAMDGRELLNVARKQNPNAVRILFSAHVAPQKWPTGCAGDADVVVLGKPTPLHELSHIITQSMRAQL